MVRCKDMTTQKASLGKKQSLLHHSAPVDAKELKEGNPCLKEWPGWDDVCFVRTGSGPYSPALSAGSVPTKIISCAEPGEEEPAAYYGFSVISFVRVA